MKVSSKRGREEKKKSSLFQRGYETAREEKKRQDAARENSGKRLYNMFLKEDGDEAQVRFLTEEPINFYAHTIRSVRDGRERFDTYACSQDDDCPYCADGDRPSYKGAYLLFDRRKVEYKDRDGKKKKSNGQIRLYYQGMRVVGQLDRLSSRYGLTKCDYIIARVGSGQNTSYTFDRLAEENDKMSKKEIESLLSEKLRDMYDGTQESLYRIVEDQIVMMLPNAEADDEDEDDDYDDEDDYEAEKKRRKNLVSYDDDDEEDEDEEDEPPRKKSSLKKSGSSAKALFSKKKR